MLLPDQSTFEVPDQLDSEDEFFDEAADEEDGEKRILRRVMRAIYDLLHEGDAAAPRANGNDDVPSEEPGTAGDEEGGLEDGEAQTDKKFFATLEVVNRSGFSTRQIMEQYNDTFQDDDCIRTVTAPVLNRALTMLKNKYVILEQTDETKRWRAKNVGIFIKQVCSKGSSIDPVDHTADESSSEVMRAL
jgi:hypothetical protein